MTRDHQFEGKAATGITRRLAAALALLLALSPSTRAEDSAPSSHLVFDDDFPGDLIINEVRVPAPGEAKYTYYEALGWRGKGAGYAGIQAHPRGHIYIFSIWDHKEHGEPIRAVHRGAKTKTERFGGEGTGLKSWNFDLGWKTDVWYSLVARTWPAGDHTRFGFWVRAGDSKRWTHLVTMDVAAKTTFRGRTDAFIEDWASSGKSPRTMHLRGGWKRKLDGTWHAFGRGRYSVNSWDLKPGKRSFNYRNNWNAGVRRDKTGEHYIMVSGGAKTRPETANPSELSIDRREKAPDFERIAISGTKATLARNGRLTVEWTLDERTAPQFAYRIEVFDTADGTGEPVSKAAATVPHARSTTLDLAPGQAGEPRSVRVTCRDIFDRESKGGVTRIRRGD